MLHWPYFHLIETVTGLCGLSTARYSLFACALCGQGAQADKLAIGAHRRVFLEAIVIFQEQGQVARFLEAHIGQEPIRYARLRVGRARRTAEAVWRRDLGPGELPARIAAEVVERHAAGSARDKHWLEIVEKAGRFAIVDTLPLGAPPEGADDDDEHGELGKGEIIGALVQAVLGANRQMADEAVSLRQALVQKDEQLLGLVGRHTELAMQAAKDGVLLRLHEEGIFHAPDSGQGMIDRVQALLPVIEKISPHVAAAYAAHRASTAPRAATEQTPIDRVEACLAEFEAISRDASLAALVVEPVRFARVQRAAAAIMAHASPGS